MKLISGASISTALTTLLFLSNTPTTSAKTYGINCKSVTNCKSGWYSTWGSYATWATDIRAMMDRIPDNVYVEPGDLIACRGLICAWVTGICEHRDCEAAIAEPVPRWPCDGSWDGVPGGMMMKEVKQKAQDLREHECKVCGEVAASWPEDKTTKDVWCSGSLKISSPSDDLRFEHECSTDGICKKFTKEAGEVCVPVVPGGCDGSRYEEASP